jgi:hypothetical protein
MIFQPAAVALLLTLTLNAMMLSAAAIFAIQLLRHWNPSIGSPLQIRLERRTYLISTLVGVALVTILPAMALFVLTADRMAPFFSGAMCAVGSLKVNGWGFPALYAMLGQFFLACAWLILHHLDRLGWDYPLIRAKHALLLILAPLAICSACFAWLYFLDLRPEVITSCCGSLFGSQAARVNGELAAMPTRTAMVVSAIALTTILGLGLAYLRYGLFGRIYGLAAMLTALVGVLAVIAFIAPYIYEQPNHHCPFCLLQPEHGHAGWLLYPPLFMAAATGIGVSLGEHAAGHASLGTQARRVARHLAIASMCGFVAFAVLSVAYIARSNLILLAD